MILKAARTALRSRAPAYLVSRSVPGYLRSTPPHPPTFCKRVQLFTSQAVDLPDIKYAFVKASSVFRYELIDGAEDLEKYEPGGYHPISIGDVFSDGRYLIIDKLGHGGYSTVRLARDNQTQRYVAIKVARADSTPQEVKALRKLASTEPAPASQCLHRGKASIPALLDEFSVKGLNGEHKCFVTLPARSNLYSAPFSRLFPTHIARALSASLAYSVAYIHSKGYAHGGTYVSCIKSPICRLLTLLI
jgi:hypothetical protein